MLKLYPPAIPSPSGGGSQKDTQGLALQASHQAAATSAAASAGSAGVSQGSGGFGGDTVKGSSYWPKGKPVFSDPTPEFYELLTKNKSPGIPKKISNEHPYSLELEVKEAKALDEAIEKTKELLREYQLQLDVMDKKVSQLNREIVELEKHQR
ncbi:hypothetical protein AX774_g4093 [Zancudomyces culisetae]|uniref:Uncharacterized protein n=1 Tax=Zancudomyces culisetae TaxID=1213189 RepID=A0A1R1PN88_ZANCU|nr:hypothetical protein AX774_g4093 [Zancudomyces culisetae]|eukprot:OMH82436.1 hypothetical protein AX774_g4093 [Zancudomyces culisetae]